jgi:hypothetical protein
MFWKDETSVLYRKGKALVVACIAAALVGVACVILSLRGSFEATVVAMFAIAAAAATGNWAHWAFKDAKKLARRIVPESSGLKRSSAAVGTERRSARRRNAPMLPQRRRKGAFSDRTSALPHGIAPRGDHA